MKKIFLLSILALAGMTAQAQGKIEHFNVGPYEVDYLGDGEVKYRLSGDVDLYSFYELQRDTVINVVTQVTEVDRAIQLSVYTGSNKFPSAAVGVEGVWKTAIADNIYFNGGLALETVFSNTGEHGLKRQMFEVGVPLQIEFGRLSRQASGVFCSVGLEPAFFSTLNAEKWNGKEMVDTEKKSGLLVTPMIEFGGNIPVGTQILRIGIYGEYKVNCSAGDFDAYKRQTGCTFIGAKLGLVL